MSINKIFCCMIIGKRVLDKQIFIILKLGVNSGKVSSINNLYVNRGRLSLSYTGIDIMFVQID